MKKTLALLAALALPAAAAASTLTGDEVTIEFNPGSIYTSTFTVGSGVDDSINNFQLNADAGVHGSQFHWTGINAGGSLAGATSFTFSDLDFTDGSTLIGFKIKTTLLDDVVASVTNGVLTVSWSTTGIVGPGPILHGQYITTSVVPLPASAPLILAGLGVLGFVGRRRNGA